MTHISVLVMAAAIVAALAASAHAAPRPNVVVVMTDDQTVAQMKALPKTQRLIGDSGATFTNFFATQPQCCPSRASYFTGQYPHNHGVRDNSGDNGGYEAFDPRESLPVWLDRAGYRTMFIGKYFNGYHRHPRVVPRGWDDWAGLADQTKMYDYTLSEDGKPVRYGDDPRDYQADVYARKGRVFIGRRHRAGGPFFLSVAPSAPHLEHGRDRNAPNDPRPAPRHRDAFSDEPLPKPPSYDEEDVSDKPVFIRNRPRIDTEAERGLRNRWRSSLKSLLAVDDLVARLVAKLRETDELDHTLFVFTSDNGYFYGEHRNRSGKSQIYEEATKVPLLMRGPGVPAGVDRDQLAGNIDLAPTILHVTGAQPGLTIDGRSLIPPAQDPAAGRDRDLLFETLDFSAVRTERWVFSANENAENELYDLSEDPYQLESLQGRSEYDEVREDLRDRLERLRSCAGDACR